MTRNVDEAVTDFQGLSNRVVPNALPRNECPDLLNVELSEGTIGPRNGFVRKHANQLRDASVRLDGVNDYLAIRNHDDLEPSNRLFVSIDVKLREFPAAEAFIVSRGSGTSSRRFLSISYDPTINTNNGGWRCRVYDNTATTLRDVTVNDGDGGALPVNEYRHLELVHVSGDGYEFRVRDSAGATIGTDAPLDIAAFVPDASMTYTDLLVGASSDGAGGLTGYAAVTVAELRYADATTAPACAGVVDRELDRGPDSNELTDVVGYWRLNDGRGTSFGNTATGKSAIAVAGAEAPEWVSDESLVLGTGGLEFFGQSGFIHWRVDAIANYIFNTTTVPGTLWAMDFVFTPRMEEGEDPASGGAGVRDQILFWAGTNYPNPQPIGLEVLSDQIKFSYRDSTNTLFTATLPGTLSTYVNQRCLINVRQIQPAATPRIEIRLYVDNPSSPVAGGTTNVAVASLVSGGGGYTAGVPGSISAQHWSIGQRISNFATFPPTPVGPSARCIISTVRFWKFPTTASGYCFGWTGLNEVTEHPAYANEQLVAQLRLNDGYGSSLTVEGVRSSIPGSNSTATLYPQQQDGLFYDEGLVEPYDAADVPMSFIADYRRLGVEGSLTRRKLMVVSGCTLYEVDLGAGTAKIAGSDLPKPGTGRWVGVQWEDELYMASPNGRRPKVWDGVGVRNAGIEPPQGVPVVSSSATGGSLADGDYYLYVTFRNGEKGEESNPSLGAAFTLGGGNVSQITNVTIPTSSDPQVTQRRIYLTAPFAGDANGPSTYLVAEINNNTDTAYATAITTLDITALPLEFLENQEPPPTSVVAIWKETLWAAGSPEYPTRVWYSLPTQLASFNQRTRYLEATSDQGDPVVALHELGNNLAIYLRDAVQFAVPIESALADYTIQAGVTNQGAVSHRGVLPIQGAHWFVGERDILIHDGGRVRNVTTPQEGPSIEDTMRNGWNDLLRDLSVAAYHRSRDQVWVTYASSGSTRNDSVIVWDFTTRKFSRYEMEMDFVAEVEDTADVSRLIGGSNGYVVELDEGMWDGHAEAAAAVAGSVTGGSTTYLEDTGKAWSTNQFKGLEVFWYDVSTDTVRRGRIRSNTATKLSFYDSVTAPAVGDVFVIAGVPWFADFLVDFGEVLTKKRLKSLRVTGISTDDANNLRVSILPDALTRTPDWSGATEYVYDWLSSQVNIPGIIGGVGRSFRMRLSQSPITAVASVDPVPSISGSIQIHAFQFMAIRTDQK